jgi:protein-disulfide isomerase
VLIAVGAAIVAIIVGVVLAVSLGGNSSTNSNVPAVGSLKGALPGGAAVQGLFAGMPQKGNTLGSSSAPVTMTEYIDLQCPYCREFEKAVLPGLVSSYVRTGKLRIEQRLLAFVGPDSVRGRSAALAAGLQNRQFNDGELLYFNQGTENTGWLDEQMVVATASSIPGLKVPQLLADRNSSVVKSEASAADAEAKAAGVNSTPTILVGPTGGTQTQVAMTSPTDKQEVVAAIEGASAG